jgi:hypothetical protein
VYKIAGALARRGASLEEASDMAQWVASHIGTIGVGQEHVHVADHILLTLAGPWLILFLDSWYRGSRGPSHAVGN